ncbi:NAD-P-binding protein [Pisolithus orientalis]|uniref:NAD-P-binding protein n=1 Tax=Pisolithus orientalis TaxID=936130 RepID=UPI002224A46A|nr:NAD-P-binding protein [Pisolithus orientalis]KAI6005031.1 NAD-P-binding protein [Pisolithus orientalis]
MRVLILGATGGIGVLLVGRAVADGHTVVVYARSPEKLPQNLRDSSQIIIRKGQLTDAESLSDALQDVDTVLSALGPAVSRGPFHPRGEPLAHAYSLIIKVMKERGVSRLIALGTPSIKDPHDKHSLVMSTIVCGVATFASTAYKDIVAIGETICREGDTIDWTIVRVPLLNSGSNESFVAGYVGDGQTTTSLTRIAFVAFVLQELTKKEWVKARPLVTSP